MDEQLLGFLLSQTRFSESTKDMVRAVLVDGRSPSEVAAEYAKSRQFVSAKVRRVRFLEKQFLENSSQFGVFLLHKPPSTDED